MFMRLLKDKSGLAQVEFALVASILITMSVGAAELGRYIILNQKVAYASSRVADVTTRYPELAINQIEDSFHAAHIITAPFNFETDGKVVVSGIGIDQYGNQVILWQHSGGGSLSAAGSVGSVGSSPVLPSPLTLQNEETAVAVEVMFGYSPLMADSPLTSEVLRSISVVRPREGEVPALF